MFSIVKLLKTKKKKNQKSIYIILLTVKISYLEKISKISQNILNPFNYLLQSFQSDDRVSPGI